MSGIGRERMVARRLEDDGFLIASRRHVGGAGDLLAIDPDGQGHLVEIKATAGGPFEHFGPSDRADLSEVAAEYGLVASLAWWPPRAQLTFLREEDWPEGKVAA